MLKDLRSYERTRVDLELDEVGLVNCSLEDVLGLRFGEVAQADVADFPSLEKRLPVD